MVPQKNDWTHEFAIIDFRCIPDSGIHSSVHWAINSTATGHSWFAFHKKKNAGFSGFPAVFFKMASLHKIVASDQ